MITKMMRVIIDFLIKKQYSELSIKKMKMLSRKLFEFNLWSEFDKKRRIEIFDASNQFKIIRLFA